MAYIKSSKEQNWLLPLNIKDLIPCDHVCFLVEDFVSGLEKVKIEMNLACIAHNLKKIWKLSQTNAY